jgi:hypothetical protein
MKNRKNMPRAIGAGVVLAASAILAAGMTVAQQAPQVENPAAAPATPASSATAAPANATAVGAPAQSSAASTKASMGLGEIESLLQRQGIRVQELEVRDSVVEAEGRDANNRKVEVIVDRRSGEILSRRFDD